VDGFAQAATKHLALRKTRPLPPTQDVLEALRDKQWPKPEHETITPQPPAVQNIVPLTLTQKSVKKAAGALAKI
jgi:hypothetical protein